MSCARAACEGIPPPPRTCYAAIVGRVFVVIIALALVMVIGCVPAVEPPADAGASDFSAHVDPSEFDCSAIADDEHFVPTRGSLVDAACALDPSCHTRQVSAHRGAGGQLGKLAPEDTLSAYRAGIALGVEFVETDPRPTADGVIVNIHDDTVDRTTDGTGEVAAMSFDELRALHIEAGERAGDFSCERIPTLVEVLQTCRGKVVVLVDANKTSDVAALVQAIHDADALDWAIFDTSDVAKIDAALALEPALRFMNRPDGIEAITAEFEHFAPRLPVIVELHQEEVDGGGVELVHQRGTRALLDVFGIDVLDNLGGAADYTPVLEAGVDILQTDRPELVIQVLRERGER
ncbi:MAG: glycerophosphodiester phosphodiesterase family protein [Deltaproteobacteria bacterium]|nr:glycerophosphodiester phosphodiesterase family protein [Deltaproteobacteria bacterium]